MVDMLQKRNRHRPGTQQEIVESVSLADASAVFKQRPNFVGVKGRDSQDEKFDINQVGILKASKTKLIRQFDQAKYESKLLQEKSDRLKKELEAAQHRQAQTRIFQ